MAISGRARSPPGRVDLKPAQGEGADSTSPGGEGVLDQKSVGLPSVIVGSSVPFLSDEKFDIVFGVFLVR